VLYPGSESKIFKEKPPKKLPSVGAFPLTPGRDNLNEESEIEKFIKDVLDYINVL